VVRGLRADFWWDCASGSRHRVWTVVPSDATKLSAPSCSVAKGMTEDGAIDDNTDIPVAHDGTVPPGRLRASTSGWDSVVVREPRFDFGGTAPQDFVAVAGLSIQV